MFFRQKFPCPDSCEDRRVPHDTSDDTADGASARRVVIVGGGPAGLMAAESAARAGAGVVLVEAGRSPGRKLVLAGRSGLNLSSTAPADRFLTAYGSDAARLGPCINAFDIDALSRWSASLGEPVVVGSSGRVFPASWRATPLLRAWLRRLGDLGVEIRTSTRCVDLSAAGAPIIDDGNGPPGVLPARATVLACGGASWPRTGSDGRWMALLGDRGVSLEVLRPANAGLSVSWSTHALRHDGEVLKDVSVNIPGGRPVRGDLVIVRSGLQGTPAYSLAAGISGSSTVVIDLRPDLSEADLADRLRSIRHGESIAHRLRRVGLSPAAVAVANEHTRNPSDPDKLARHVKSVPIELTGTEPLDRAISTVGGVAWSALTDQLRIDRLGPVFAAGEMIAWNAPTGGYLLHACLATGAWAGRHAAALALSVS